MARRRGTRKGRWALTDARRDFAFFVIGVAGLAFLTLFRTDPPTILVLAFLGLMGLPVALGVDERTRRHDDTDDTKEHRG